MPNWAAKYLQATEGLEESTYVVRILLEQMHDEIVSLKDEIVRLEGVTSAQELQLDSCRRIIEGLGHQTNE